MTTPNAMDASPPNPARIFEAITGYQLSAVLRGAIELDLFTTIGQNRRTSDELAKTIGASPRGMRILCDYLTVHRFLIKEGDAYGLTPESSLFLDKNSPQFMGSAVRFRQSPDFLHAFHDVAELVRQGTTLLKQQGTTKTDYEGWVEFARSMVSMMMAPAQFMAKVAAERKPGPIRVLDIAAGHGVFGVLLAKENPQASVVALDWPNVLTVAQENANRLGVADRYQILPGDALEIDYGRGFDVVLVTNFLHHFNESQCVSVMRKIRDCLNDDGLVMTLEFIPNADRVTPPVSATFSMTMLATTPEGDAYLFDEYQAMWKQAGLDRHEMIQVPDSSQQLMISQR